MAKRARTTLSNKRGTLAELCGVGARHPICVLNTTTEKHLSDRSRRTSAQASQAGKKRAKLKTCKAETCNSAQAQSLASLNRFACVVAYDGTTFHGWQKQGTREPNTVQGHIERRLASMLGHPCNIIGNGRTDAGVHSLGTVFHVDLTNYDCARLKAMIDGKSKNSSKVVEEKGGAALTVSEISVADLKNIAENVLLKTLRRGVPGGDLPDAIRVMQVFPVNLDRFHARGSCVGKRYLYNIAEGFPDPLRSRSCWSLHGKKLDVSLMEKATKILCGLHDFSLFGRVQEGDTRSPIRRLSRLAVIKESRIDELGYGFIRIEAECDFFLWNMCRRLVGLLVNVGLGRVTVAEVASAVGPHSNNLTKQDKNKLLRTAPAKGLCLDCVWYMPSGVGLQPSIPAL